MKTWVKFLRDNYASYDEWRAYSNTFGLAKKLGGQVRSLWRENPLVGGSTDPANFGRVPVTTLPVYAPERAKEGLPLPEPAWSQYKLCIEGSAIFYETADSYLNVLSVRTQKQFRGQGRATALITLLLKSAKKNGQTIDWGAFTPKGQKYLVPVIERLTKESL